jgi:hypothetical protein
MYNNKTGGGLVLVGISEQEIAVINRQFKGGHEIG